MQVGPLLHSRLPRLPSLLLLLLADFVTTAADANGEAPWTSIHPLHQVLRRLFKQSHILTTHHMQAPHNLHKLISTKTPQLISNRCCQCISHGTVCTLRCCEAPYDLLQASR